MPSLQSPTPSSGKPDPLAGVVQGTLQTVWVVVAVVVVAVLAIAVQAAFTDRQSAEIATPTTAENMVAVAPGGVLAAADVPPAFAAHYQAARDHRHVFEAVPCFCGCEGMLDHRHLGDCFVRADGQGLEAHALGCGVCIGEAQQVIELIAAGTEDPDQINEAVVAEWGDPYTNG